MEVTPQDVTTAEAQGKGHPKGLGVLFTTEMWERFNFYGMRTILSLFLSEALVMGDKQASIIYGGYLGLCYLTPMLGGYISDRFLGNRNCILLGGLTMMMGQFMLFASASIFHDNLSLATTITWSALGVIIFGNGFFKPNISSMVGQLYPKDQKTKLDSAFTIFYMGINVGALLGQFICPLVGDVINVTDGKEIRDLSAFKWGFLAAGIAMFLGTTSFFFLKNKYVITPEGKAIGGRPDKQVAHGEESNRAHFTSSSLVILVASAVILYFLFQYFAWDPVEMPMKGSGLGGYFSALAISPVETFIYPLIYSLAIALAIFILTDKSLTKVETQRIMVLYIVAFFVIFFWAAFEQSGSSLTFIADKQTDRNFLGWLMPPSMVQLFNSLFIIIFAIPFSYMWARLQTRKLEPISTVKQAYGLILIGIGYWIIASRVKGLGDNEMLNVGWFVALYLFHTWGELCLSPIGLSLVAKLAPKQIGRASCRERV